MTLCLLMHLRVQCTINKIYMSVSTDMCFGCKYVHTNMTSSGLSGVFSKLLQDHLKYEMKRIFQAIRAILKIGYTHTPIFQYTT